MATRIYRNEHDRIVTGLSSGIEDRYDRDPTLVRLMWVVLCTVTFGVASIV